LSCGKVSFQDTSGREGPAGTTLSLIFDGSNSTLLSPIDLRSNIIKFSELESLCCDFRDQLCEVSLFEFLISQVKEHCLSESGFSLGFIKLLNVLDVVIENLESVAILS
jgi:hypothetical protein